MTTTAVALVVTPRPFKNESLLGYLLRVSASNGYATPWNVLTPLHISRRESMSADFPVDKLSTALACAPSRLASIAYTQRLADGSTDYKILNHSLGQAPRARTYRLTRQAFCPACVAEKRYIEAHWDLEGVTVCHIHGTRLLTHCPECKRHIKPFRPDILECVCGARWDNVLPPAASREERALATLLNSRILGTSHEACDTLNLPTADLERLPVKSLLASIDVIGKTVSNSTDSVEIFAEASNVFAHWPSRYEQLLEMLIAHKGRQTLRSFRHSLAKAKIPVEQGQWLMQPITRRLAEIPPVTPTTSRTISATSKAGQRSRASTADGNLLGERKAAAYLGMPVSALVALRDSGHYAVQNRPARVQAFHRADLDAFRDKLLGLSGRRVISTLPGRVKLGYILQEFRTRSRSGKGEIIAAILDGKLKPLGISGMRIEDIVMSKQDVISFATKIRTIAEGNSLSITEVSDRLSCDPLTVPSLIELGLLSAVPGPDRTRVTIDSVELFSETHVALAAIARKARKLSRRLCRLCELHDIPRLDVLRTTGRPQPFIARADLPRLAKVIGVAELND